MSTWSPGFFISEREQCSPSVPSGDVWSQLQVCTCCIGFSEVQVLFFKGPMEAGGSIRPPVERAPSFVMRAEQLTRAGSLASPLGRRPLSPEYPSSIADALCHDQGIFR